MAVQDSAAVAAVAMLVETRGQLGHQQRRRQDEDIDNVKCICKLLELAWTRKKTTLLVAV
jgi:fructose-specific phosphotransferase system component IIB